MPEKAMLRSRLVTSFIENGFNGYILLANDSCGYPGNDELNYGFKSYCLNEARRMGVEIAIWADSNMVLCQPVESLIESIEDNPIFLPTNADWRVGQWTTDRCLAEFGVSRETAYDIPTVVSGFIAFDFRNESAREFFDEFSAYCKRPEIINGPRYVKSPVFQVQDYFGHRHDQSILSLMAHNKGINLVEGVYGDPTNAVGVPTEFQIPTTERTIIEWLP